MEDILLQIKRYAEHAHNGQMRKYSSDKYIVHPIKVMETCSLFETETAVLAAALLHDVLEDTPVTAEELSSFLKTRMNKEFAETTLRLVAELTDVFTEEAYPALNRKQRKEKETARLQQASGNAQTIKYADILDNCNEITVHDPGFAPRFLKECLNILQVADKGNTELRTLTFEKVYNELKDIKKRKRF